MTVSLRTLFQWGGKVGRLQYVLLGVLLFALKFWIDGMIAHLFGKDWRLRDYAVSGPGFQFASVPASERPFYLAMLTLAIPFVYCGIALTVRRLRSAGLSEFLCLLFFVPAANVLFFTILAWLPELGEGRHTRAVPAEPQADTEIPAAFELARGELHDGSGQRVSDTVQLAYAAKRSNRLRSLCDRHLPKDSLYAFCVAMLLPFPVAVGLTILGTQLLRNYGWGLFVGMPFSHAVTSVMLYGYRTPRTWRSCVAVAWAALGVWAVGILVVAIEGAVCLIMASPLILAMGALGAGFAYHVLKLHHRGWRVPVDGIVPSLLLILPVLMGAESVARVAPALRAVVTTVDVAAPPDRVWARVVSFPPLPAPREWLFLAGIAYPMRAEILGHGAGAVRHCVFSTGTFVEPIELWDEPHLLQFSVTSQPPPMRELSPYANIQPPHLEGFLASRRGQFRVELLHGGFTRLEGTTWYENQMWPEWYWSIWSDHIIHTIHRRVLDHIKVLAERA